MNNSENVLSYIESELSKQLKIAKQLSEYANQWEEEINTMYGFLLVSGKSFDDVKSQISKLYDDNILKIKKNINLNEDIKNDEKYDKDESFHIFNMGKDEYSLIDPILNNEENNNIKNDQHINKKRERDLEDEYGEPVRSNKKEIKIKPSIINKNKNKNIYKTFEIKKENYDELMSKIYKYSQGSNELKVLFKVDGKFGDVGDMELKLKNDFVNYGVSVYPNFMLIGGTCNSLIFQNLNKLEKKLDMIVYFFENIEQIIMILQNNNLYWNKEFDQLSEQVYKYETYLKNNNIEVISSIDKLDKLI